MAGHPDRQRDQFLLHYVFGLFAERITELIQLVEAVAFHQLDQRLATLLLGKGKMIHTTHQQLADELGSVRAIVTRLLKTFAEQGLVSIWREEIEIVNPSMFRRLAAGGWRFSSESSAPRPSAAG